MPYKDPEALKECYRRYYQRHKKEKAQRQRDFRHKRLPYLRNQVLCLLGKKCVSCGFDNPLALELDHVHNNGSEDRRKKGRNGVAYYSKVLKELLNGSKDYQLLCSNCNHIKEMKRRGY